VLLIGAITGATRAVRFRASWEERVRNPCFIRWSNRTAHWRRAMLSQETGW